MTCRLSFSASTDNIFKHCVHSAIAIFHNVIFYVRVVKFTQFRFSRWALLYLPSQLSHPLSKNLYILNSLRIYQHVHVVVFTSTSTVW